MGIKAIVFDFGNVVSRFDHWLTTDRLAPRARDIIYTRTLTLAEGQQAVQARPADPAAHVALGRAELATGQVSAH